MCRNHSISGPDSVAFSSLNDMADGSMHSGMGSGLAFLPRPTDVRIIGPSGLCRSHKEIDHHHSCGCRAYGIFRVEEKDFVLATTTKVNELNPAPRNGFH